MTPCRPLALIAVACCLVLPLAGCKNEATGSRYAMGTFENTLAASVPQAMEAAVDVMADMNMTVNKKEVMEANTQGLILGRTAEDVAVRIELFESAPGTTRARIRIGLSGDKQYSEALYNRIRSQL